MPLPQPGDLDWGERLNVYLQVGHDDDGRHQAVIDVGEHGAAGDGITDDTQAINAALAAAGAVVATTPVPGVSAVTAMVLLSPGRYRVRTLVVPSGVVLQGIGRASVLQHDGSATDCVTINPTRSEAAGVHGVQLRDLVILGGASSQAGVHAYFAIRQCSLHSCVISGFNVGIHLEKCWTFRVVDALVQSSGTHNLLWDGATNGMILGGRFDAAGSDSIKIHNTLINTEGLLIAGAASQFSGGAGIWLDGIKHAVVADCFLEGNCKTNATRAHLQANLDGAGSVEIRGNYLNRGGTGGDGVAACWVSGVKNCTYVANISQGQPTGLWLDSDVEAATVSESTFGNPLERVRRDSGGFVTIKEGYRPTLHYGLEMNPAGFNGLLRSSLVAADPANRYVALGTYNGLPTVQGGGTGTSFHLRLNPHGGNVGVGLGSGNPTEKLHVAGGVRLDPDWDSGGLVLGVYHLWIDGSGGLRMKQGAPTSATDGTVIGSA